MHNGCKTHSLLVVRLQSGLITKMGRKESYFFSPHLVAALSWAVVYVEVTQRVHHVREITMNQQHNQYRSAKEILKRALNEVEAAQYICMSRSFLRQSRMMNHCQKDDGDDDDSDCTEIKPLEARTPGPCYIRVGSRSIRYLIDDLDAWLESFRLDSNR